MKKREEYKSPDGLLCLVVLYEDDDITIGFEGFDGHTHGDVLVAEYKLLGISALSEEAAAERFVKEILSGQRPIVLIRVAGVLTQAWVTDDPQKEFKYQQAGESLEIRCWDGRPWQNS